MSRLRSKVFIRHPGHLRAHTLNIRSRVYDPRHPSDKSATNQACIALPAESHTRRKMKLRRPFSEAEAKLMDSVWNFQHPGGSFEVEFRADAFNHFVSKVWLGRHTHTDTHTQTHTHTQHRQDRCQWRHCGLQLGHQRVLFHHTVTLCAHYHRRLCSRIICL